MLERLINIQKNIYISLADIKKYNKVIQYTGEGWPQSFFLTLWQHFKVTELQEKKHLLAEQIITCFKEVELNEEYVVSLERIRISSKKESFFWTYMLTIEKEGQLYVQCQTKIYVKETNNI